MKVPSQHNRIQLSVLLIFAKLLSFEFHVDFYAVNKFALGTVIAKRILHKLKDKLNSAWFSRFIQIYRPWTGYYVIQFQPKFWALTSIYQLLQWVYHWLSVTRNWFIEFPQLLPSSGNHSAADSKVALFNRTRQSGLHVGLQSVKRFIRGPVLLRSLFMEVRKWITSGNLFRVLNCNKTQ